MAARERFRAPRRPGQQVQEAFDPSGIEAVAGRELPEEGARLAAEQQDAAGEKVGQGLLSVAQLQVVRV